MMIGNKTRFYLTSQRSFNAILKNVGLKGNLNTILRTSAECYKTQMDEIVELLNFRDIKIEKQGSFSQFSWHQKYRTPK